MATATAAKQDGKVDHANIGISETNSKKVANELNKILADEMVLYIKTLKTHWNIIGKDFHALHIFLDEQYHSLQSIIDSVAERIRKVGHFSNGSMQEFQKDASIKELTETGPIKEAKLAELASDHEDLIRRMRKLIDDFEEKYDDAGSADFITGIMREHEEMAWMLRASVSK